MSARAIDPAPRRRNRPVTLATALGAVIISTLTPRARAGGIPDLPAGWYLPAGLAVAATFPEDLPAGVWLGGEFSVISMDQPGPEGTWLGPTAEAGWDFGADAFRHGLGCEFGIAVLGLEAGYLGQLRDGRYAPGLYGRASLTFGVFSVYGRYGHIFAEPLAMNLGEVGVMLRYPFELSLAAGEPEPQPPAKSQP